MPIWQVYSTNREGIVLSHNFKQNEKEKINVLQGLYDYCSTRVIKRHQLT